MNIKVIVTIGLSVVLSISISYFLFMQAGVFKKEAYIDTIKVFNEFDLKKSLEKKLDVSLGNDRHVIDSLKLSLQALYSDSTLLGNERFLNMKSIQNDIEQKTYEASQNERILTDKYNTQIWKQLNQYIKEYGKSKDLDLMYGANGQGTILYAKEKYDLSKECIIYVNNKYLGVE